MKKIVLVIVFFATLQFQAQTSSGITYQAVIYSPTGQILPGNNQNNLVLSNKSICLRFSILDRNTQLEYQETVPTQTDDFGMVNLVIGGGNQVGGYATNYNNVLWDGSNKKLRVELDLTTYCNVFETISEQLLTSVPFSNYAKLADNVTGTVAITNGGTGATNVAGAKVNLGLNNVDNTSDLNKPISTATQSVLNIKENTSNKSVNVALGTSDVLYPTQNAVKTYVDSHVNSNTTGLNTEISRATAAETNLATFLVTEKNRAMAEEALKENTTNKSDDVNLGTSSNLFPTQNAVKTYVDSQITTATPNASQTVKGKIKLGGDLSGTADAPTVPGLATKENAISIGTTNQYFRGDKTWQNLNSTAVGLGNVDNTSDVNKAISTATQTALDAKEDVISIGTTTQYLRGDKTWQTAVQSVNGVLPASNGNVSVMLGRVTTGVNSSPLSAVPNPVNSDIYVVAGQTSTPNDNGRTYIYDGTNWQEVASNISGSDNRYVMLSGSNMSGNLVFPAGHTLKLTDAPVNGIDAANKDYVDGINLDATTLATGKIQLAGDLSGTANAPTVPGLATKAPLNSPALTGLPTAPTATTGTNSTQIATTEFVTTALATKQNALTNPVTGAGSQNKIAKFSNTGSTLADSQIFDNGTNVGIGTVSPSSKLEINSGTAGTSGLKFTNLTSTTTPSLSNNYLSLDTSGNVVYATNGGTMPLITANGVYSATSEVRDYNTWANRGNGFYMTDNLGAVSNQIPNSTAWFTVSQVAKGTTHFGQTALTDQNFWFRGGYNSTISSNSWKRMISVDANSRFALFWDNTTNNTVNLNNVDNGPLLLSTNNTERVRILASGNVGVGVSNPTSKLEINGAVTNTLAYDAVANTTIDFSQSNLAFTTASAGSFTLTNIKTGGTYTLAVQGATAGTSVFTSSGFTFKYVNNGVTTANKHTLYTFLVMGTTVYVYMATGF